MQYSTMREAYDAASRQPGLIAVVHHGFRVIDAADEQRLFERREEFAYITQDQSGRLMTVPVN